MATVFKDFLLDPSTGDLDFSSKGLQVITSNQMSLRQRLYLRFSIWQGTWYFDESIGFPYGLFIAKKTSKTVLDNRIRKEVRQEPDVIAIEGFTSSIDINSRSYKCFFTVVTSEGEEINFAFLGEDAYDYPTPPEGNVELCGSEGALIEFKNKLYYLINFQLPKYGDSTWINNWK